jgi:hypothetical protein
MFLKKGVVLSPCCEPEWMFQFLELPVQAKIKTHTSQCQLNLKGNANRRMLDT